MRNEKIILSSRTGSMKARTLVNSESYCVVLHIDLYAPVIMCNLVSISMVSRKGFRIIIDGAKDVVGAGRLESIHKTTVVKNYWLPRCAKDSKKP